MVVERPQICIILRRRCIVPSVTTDCRTIDRLDAAREFLLRAFETACLAHNLTSDERAAILEDLAVATGGRDAATSISVPLPDRAPEIWSERDRTQRQNPAQFVRRVYAQWIGRGLTRQALCLLDEPVYRALSVWEHRHPEDRIHEILTLSEVIDSKISSLSAEFTPDELKTLGTTLQSRLARQRKQAKNAAIVG